MLEENVLKNKKYNNKFIFNIIRITEMEKKVLF